MRCVFAAREEQQEELRSQALETIVKNEADGRE
jgi:hypothetical protein